jgi:hypothetical protein
MLKHGTQNTSIFHVVKRLSRGPSHNLADANKNVDAELFVGDVYGASRGELAEQSRSSSERALQGERAATKATGMMNNRSQKPRACEGLGHGAYAKGSRIEVERWKKRRIQ